MLRVETLDRPRCNVVCGRASPSLDIFHERAKLVPEIGSALGVSTVFALDQLPELPEAAAGVDDSWNHRRESGIVEDGTS